MLTQEFIGVASPTFGDEELDEVVRTMQSGWVIAGPRVSAFEQLIGDYTGAPQVRCLSSCSAGLLLGLRCQGVERGDEVLVPSMTFAACTNAIEQLGATPVFVDCHADTGLIDLEHAATLVTSRTRALIAVHLGGRPIDPGQLSGVRDRYGLAVVEDAAHAVGARWGERPVGGQGNPTAFSFHATKNMTTIEGGALTLESEAVAARVKRLSGQGISSSAWQRHGTYAPADYDLIEPGYKLGMTDVQAAVGLHQLGRLDAAITAREEIRCRYDEAFAGLPVDLEPPVPPGVRHARHLYRLLVRPEAGVARDDLMVGLRQRGIGSSVHFKPLHTMTYYAGRAEERPEALPASLEHASRTISLPLYPGLREAEQERVVDAVRSVLSAPAGRPVA